jgi:hypothetical protein
MRTQLTDEAIADYQQNGFLVVPDFLNADELAHWQQTTQKAVDERLATKNGYYNQQDPDAYYAQVFTQCVKLADSNAGMRELMFDARLGEMAGRLAGVDGIRIWHDQALFKPPFGNPTAWHLDNLNLGRSGRCDPCQRLHVVHPRQRPYRNPRQRGHRDEYGGSVQTLSALARG